MTKQEFNEMYFKAQPKPVREMMSMLDPAAREQRARDLVRAGYLIDVPAMVWYVGQASSGEGRSDAYEVMVARLNNTPPIKWVLSGGFDPPPSVVTNFPGLPGYDPDRPPPVHIKVSLDPADYPVHPDFVASDYPFDTRWPFRRDATSGEGEAYGPATDDWPVGSKTKDGKFEKVAERMPGGPVAFWVRN